MKKIIITGSTSMLGVSFIQECLRHNAEVAALIRPGSANAGRLLKFAGLKIIECDLGNINSLPVKLSGRWDAFYHLGWCPTDKSGRNDPYLQNANIGYTLEAVRSAKKLGCSLFLGAGSQAEYGRVQGNISADMRLSPETAYGIAKYAAGKLSAFVCKDSGIRHVWSRIFSVYGANDSPSTMISYCIDKLFKKEKPSLTGCEQIWDYLYCDDAARALYLLGEKGHDQSVYNVGSGEGKPLCEFVLALRDAIDPKLDIGFGDLAYQPGQIMHLCADISTLTRDTGFVPEVSFQDGIKRTIDQIRQNMAK
jgi:UDP-glucose 4-epimerase